jgi:DNA-binding GntR family transcriptional regulator
VRVAGPPPSSVEVVAEALREALAAGRLRQGERIKEVPLARQLGVSRGPIRDALRLLAHDGLVEILPNRGAVVPTIRAVDVLEVYALRASIGSLALQKLLREPQPAAGQGVARALAALERAVARGDERRAAEADLAFQSALIESAGLPRVAQEFERLTWQVRQFIALLDIHYDDRLATMLEEVRALHAALAARDAPGAEALWREKLERWVRHFSERLPGEDFDAGLWIALTSARND